MIPVTLSQASAAVMANVIGLIGLRRASSFLTEPARSHIPGI